MYSFLFYVLYESFCLDMYKVWHSIKSFLTITVNLIEISDRSVHIHSHTRIYARLFIMILCESFLYVKYFVRWLFVCMCVSVAKWRWQSNDFMFWLTSTFSFFLVYFYVLSLSLSHILGSTFTYYTYYIISSMSVYVI